ncbi:MAG: tetratricopeptide repeat protein [Bacteroidetes bacterium]|nr:tetratricopeptide repeat protein [Bacteroidota bacterium]
MVTFRKKLICLLLLTIGFFCQQSLPAQDLKTAIRLTDNEQFVSAKAIYEALIKKEPNNGDNYYYFGESYLKSYFSDSANVELKEMTSLANVQFIKGMAVDSLNPLNYVGLGKIALYTGSPAIAQNYFEKAQLLLPVRGKKIVMPMERQVAVYQKIAEAYLRAPRGDTVNVFPYLRKAEKLDKKSPETYLVRGDAYLFLINDGSNAIVNYKKAQDLDPRSARAKLKLGQLWVRAKRPMDALSYYQEAIKIDSTFAPAYRELAELYSMAAQYDNAQKAYKTFLDLNQQNLGARVRYASFLFLSKKYAETIKQSQEIISQDDSYTFLYRIAGYSSYETGQYDQGLNFMKSFFSKTKPEKMIPSDYSYLGKIYSKLGQDSLAVINYQKCFDMDDTNIDILGEMAQSFNKLKKYSETARIWEKKISMLETPAYTDYMNLGKAYYQAQKWGKSDTAFVKVTQLKPEFIQAYLWRARVYSNLDPETKEGLAKPFYETVIEKASADSVKNSKELLESCSFLAYYYFKNKKYCESLDYWMKVEAIDPNNEKANSAIKELKPRCPRK